MNQKSKRIFAGILSAAVLTASLHFTVSAANSDNSSSSETDKCTVGGFQPITVDMLDDEHVISTLSDYYDYVADNAETKSERKKAEELSAKANSNDYGAANLPRYCDNSNSIYFPEIGSQGGINSCAAWATTYYQYTYSINKARGVKTTKSNTYSPNFEYNLINHGCDGGSTSLRLYELLKTQGAVTIEDVPIDNTERGTTEYIKIGRCYSDWFATGDIWEHSLDNRISDYVYYVPSNIKTSDYVNGITLVSKGTPVKNVDSEEISKVKAALSSGEVLAFASSVYAWRTAEVNSNNFKGEAIVYAVGSDAPNHEMTIVGYNDDIWVDINGNNKVDQGEMGAFKIANSWGTGTWSRIGKNNNGFIWIAYDALNTVSAVKDVDKEINENRGTAFYEVSGITVKTEKSSGIYLEYELNVANRSQAVVSVQAKDKNGNYLKARELDADGLYKNTYTTDFMVNPYSIPYMGQIYNSYYDTYYYNVGERSFNGTYMASDGKMTYDLSNVVEGINSDNLDDYEWSVKVSYNTYSSNSVLTVKDIKIVDKNKNKEYGIADKNLALKKGTKTFSIPISDNTVTIYYKGYSTPYIHYQAGNGAWTAVPGVAMTATNELSGYTHKYTINLGSENYANVCFNNGSGSWDSNNGSNYKFTKGSYTFSNGTIKAYSGNVSIALSSKVSIKEGNLVPTGYSFTINASATGGTAPYQYRYSYITGNADFLIKDYSISTSAIKNFVTPGTYDIKVTVKDAKGNTSETFTSLTAGHLSVDKIQPDKTSVKTNETVNFISTITNSKNIPITYSYKVKDSSGNVQTLTTNSKNGTSWTLSKEGTYTISAELLFNGVSITSNSISYTVDKGSENSENIVTIYYKGYSTPYIHYRVGSGAWTTAPGAAMTATSEVSGYTHKYTISLGSSSNATFCFNDGKGNWDSNNGSNYTITKGTYTFANGSLSPYNGGQQDNSKNQTIIYYKGYSTPYIHYQVGNGSWTAAPGVAMTATNEASGYTHKYTIDLGTASYVNVCFNNGGSIWDSNNGSNYKFIRGTYNFSNGIITIKRDDVSVVAQYTNDSTINSDKIVLGNTINVKANAFGGVEDYTFAVYYKLSTDSKWITKQNYSKNTNVSIKPTTAAVYNICVKAKDADGSIAKKYFTVTVNPKLSNNSKISASSISLGKTFKVTAKASGGIGDYTYAVYYKKTSDTKWTLKQNYNSNSTLSIKPKKAASYDVCVKVKDSNGTIVKKNFTVNVK